MELSVIFTTLTTRIHYQTSKSRTKWFSGTIFSCPLQQCAINQCKCDHGAWPTWISSQIQELSWILAALYSSVVYHVPHEQVGELHDSLLNQRSMSMKCANYVFITLHCILNSLGELAECLERLYGPVCYVGIDIDPELKYPKGAARVTFVTTQAFIAAINGRFVHVHHGESQKRVISSL